MSNRLESKIEYEQLPAGGGMTRRQGRWLIILLIVNTMLLAVGVVGPQIGPTVRKQIDDYLARRAAAKAEQQKAASRAQRHQQFLAQQAQWMSFNFPPNTVVYEEDPQVAAANLISGKGYRGVERLNSPYLRTPLQPPVIAPVMPMLQGLQGFGFGGAETLLLVHERRTPGGAPKLVCVSFHAVQDAANAGGPRSDDRRLLSQVTLFASVLDPVRADAADAVDPSALNIWKQQRLALVVPPEAGAILHFTDNSGSGAYELRPGPYLRLLGGTVDPHELSHFMIPYQLGTHVGTIDGWLREDAIELRGHEGEMGPQSSWILPPP